MSESIEQLALRVAREYLAPDGQMNESDAVQFAQAFLSELAKQQEPAVYIRRDQLQNASRYPFLCEASSEPRQDRIPLYLRPAIPQPAAVPDGWQIVPKEPTPEMMQAGFDVNGSHLYGLTYRAMLTAAPMPSSE